MKFYKDICSPWVSRTSAEPFFSQRLMSYASKKYKKKYKYINIKNINNKKYKYIKIYKNIDNKKYIRSTKIYFYGFFQNGFLKVLS